jgi:hypothetical protein
MSDKPVAERLQVKNGRRLTVIDAPAGLDGTIGAHDARTDIAEADVVLLFVTDRARFDAAVPPTLAKAPRTAILWIAYPKLTSKLAGDLNRNIIHNLAPSHGLDTVSQIAIDADWSALRFKRV